ncbi:Cytochrome c [Rosistilla carotiformis]|uniref:Cytochrome c n=1 Tax=Rosistilla carotiformis TaxID=2528017 RepID=A0A518JSA7_9BACT|nr:cytochrome c [Rosistilla carotiformis]QDV68429.1 Cytochrome c [Rosistilla carotiformis]
MKTIHLSTMLIGLAALVGCEKPYVAEFEPNMVYAKLVSMSVEEPMDQALAETQIALTRLFGTPDDPKLPDFLLEDPDLGTLVTMENLVAASGSPSEEGRGLYRQHCSTCHGITGNGRGTTAALLDPYPRDYRMGKFKFKSTRRGSKPVREDLHYSITHGIDGTAMKAIPELNAEPEQVEALIDYVMYLTWRGEVERAMLQEAEVIDFAAGETLFDNQMVNKYLQQYKDDFDPETITDEAKREEYELFVEQWEFITDITFGAVEGWLDAEDAVIEVPEPEEVPVPETIDEVVAAAQSADDSPLKQSIERGRALFVTERAACAKCHGPKGWGDGKNKDYDDWTKDWTLQHGIDPTDEAAQIPLIARGVLPPRLIVPRDFREGLFRGGPEPERLYLRISAGIDGTPMPSATLETNQIWDLVNFVRSLRETPAMTIQ